MTSQPLMDPADKPAGLPRFWTLDALRGVALCMMLLSNALFDLALFGGRPEFAAGGWLLFARATATLFILVAGVSLTLKYRKHRQDRYPAFLRRAAKVFGAGLLITAVTVLLVPGQYVAFGILHLIGFGTLLALPLLARPRLALLAGVLLLAAGLLPVSLPAGLLWVGFPLAGYQSVDYTPLIPWLGILLLGAAAGHALFPGGRPRKPVSPPPLPGRALAFLGRHTLLLYLVHQPLLVAGFWLLGWAALPL
ncbi:MAG: DUF1624 domain-containing protein [Candidatus Aenigmarchaeota archaeon]|nr:DUF1624 domain-containing protein [Candidatus Aenigmarchaeota archaeon]